MSREFQVHTFIFEHPLCLPLKGIIEGEQICICGERNVRLRDGVTEKGCLERWLEGIILEVD